MIRKVLLGSYFAAWLVAGCGDASLPEDMCSWIADDNNCLQRFATDLGERCGGPFDATSDAVGSATGNFATRDKLDICAKTAGGQVVFDPPLDLAMFPLMSASFKLLDEQALSCGSASFTRTASSATVTGTFSYSMTIEPAESSDPADPITGGTFSIAVAGDAKNTYDVVCPGEVEKYHFNTLILDKCPSLLPFQPKAILETSPGIPETSSSPAKAGYVRFRVEYPPQDVEATTASPKVVEYFNCAIPAPPPPCEDGLKNGTETAIDCGGSSCAAKGFRCGTGQACVSPGDCASGKCNVLNGKKQCVE